MADIVLENISKSYDGKKIIENCSVKLKQGQIYCIMGESGIGKTTLFNIMMGLEKSDSGSVTGVGKISAVFQEDRLIDGMSAVDNVLFACKSNYKSIDKNTCKNVCKRSTVIEELSKLIDKQSLKKKVCELSGGMRRRVSVVRAMLAESETIFLDEPFTGLDKESKNKTMEYIVNKKGDRTLLIITHDIADVSAINGRILTLTTVDTVATILRK